jgi:transposase
LIAAIFIEICASESPFGVCNALGAFAITVFAIIACVLVVDGQVCLRAPADMPSASVQLESPYDPEARYASKGDRHGVGYKVHLTETCDDDLPHLLTQVETTIAPAAELETLALIQADLERTDLLPAEQVVDAGYVRGKNLVASQTAYQINLVGPIYADRQWQAKAGTGFDVGAFSVDWEARRVTCPHGRQSLRWRETQTARGRVMIHVDFARADCTPCPVRAMCTRAKTLPRSLTLQPQAEHEAIQAARTRQQTAAYAATYDRRAGIEGTISQSVRRFGLRRSRCRGLAKTHLQHTATAAALNLGRLANWFNEAPRARTRCSRFAALAPTP